MPANAYMIFRYCICKTIGENVQHLSLYAYDIQSKINTFAVVEDKIPQTHLYQCKATTKSINDVVIEVVIESKLRKNMQRKIHRH